MQKLQIKIKLNQNKTKAKYTFGWGTVQHLMKIHINLEQKLFQSLKVIHVNTKNIRYLN